MIPIISLWQPWASLVVNGEKRIETRSWRWPKNLPSFLAIHAAKKWNHELRVLSKTTPFKESLTRYGFEGGRGLALPFGRVVGVVRIVECVATSMLPRDCTGESFAGMTTLAGKYLAEFEYERHFGDYTYGRYAWAFDRHVAIEPIEMRGHQSLWSWEPTKEIQEWMEREP